MAKKQKKQKKPRLAPINSQLPLSKTRKLELRGPRYYLQHAREYPIFGCWVYADWKDGGLAPVVVAREQEDGKIMFCVCLLDLYCMGIKSCYARTDYSRNKFERELPEMCIEQPQPCSVEFAHELIYGALDYAQKYGLEPDPDFTYELVDQFLDPPDAHPRTENLEFGKDGKPLYVSGPYDDERTVNRILNTLTRTAGEGNFDYLVGFGDPGEENFDDEDWDDEEFEDEFDDDEEAQVEGLGTIIIDAEAEDTQPEDEEKPGEGQK